MSKKKKTLIAVFAILAIALVGLTVGVVAKYIASISKTGTATVAKWAFEGDNSAATLECGPESGISYNADTLADDGLLAPGTSGTCTLELSNANSQVGVSYTITPSITGKPSNLVLSYNGNAFSNSTPITGTMTPGETGKVITIDWTWPYNNTDANNLVDSQDGAAGGELSIVFNIAAEQVQPN